MSLPFITVPTSDFSTALAFSRDGARLAIAGGATVSIVRLSEPAKPLTITAPHAVADVVFLGDDLLIAWQNRDGKASFGVLVVDPKGTVTAKTKPLPLKNNGDIRSCVVSADESLVAVSRSAEATVFWGAADLRAGKAGTIVETGGSGSAAPLAFASDNSVWMPLPDDDDVTELVIVRADGSSGRVSTGEDVANAISVSGDRACLIGGSCNATCAIVDKKGKVLGKLFQTFEVAVIDGERVFGSASSHASIKKSTNWKVPKDPARATGFLAVADTTGALLASLTLGLKPNNAVRSIAVSSQKHIAVGTNDHTRVYPWAALAP